MPQKKSEAKIQGEKSYQIEVFDTEGKVVGKISLPEKIFGAKVNQPLLAQAVRVYLASQRQGTQKTKTRGEVQISTAKIWRQKGTGRARHGAKSAPIFVGGGVAHGPRPRDFSQKMPKKMRRAALFSALSSKFKDKSVVAIEGLEKASKAKELAGILKKFGSVKKGRTNLLVISPQKIENLRRAASSLPGIDLSEARLLNTYLVLNHTKLLFCKESFLVLEKTFLPQLKGSKTKIPTQGGSPKGEKWNY